MIKTILVPLSGADEDRHALGATRIVLNALAAHVEALYVRPDAAELVRTAGFGDYGTGAMLEDMLRRFEEESKALLDRARQQFNAFVAGAGLASREKPEAGAASASASWREEKGDEAEMTTRRAVPLSPSDPAADRMAGTR